MRYTLAMIQTIDGILFYVQDLAASSSFYEKLGARLTPFDGVVMAQLENFTFHLVDEAKAHFAAEAKETPRGGGMFLYIKVEEIDNWYKKVCDLGLKPSSEPRDWPWGNREFVLRDPDGYKLAFYEPLPA